MGDDLDGPLLKTTVTKADVEAFCDVCVPMRSIWKHFQILFEGTESQRQLLQNIAPIFFGDLNKLLIEHLILQICKITDPEDSRGHKNITVEFLVKNSDFSDVPEELGKLEKLSLDMHHFRTKIVPARNKLIGHLDRDSVLQDQPLGAADQNEWNQFWLDLQDFLNIMHKRYVDRSGQFYLNGIGYLSDADILVNAIGRES